ncbi:glycosyltransferase [Methylocella tundrae]|jgi:glycosyltransferase involved in cell wall biosynthesis|uniref:Glycosyltransferase involved in cell wall bisynthesis n=1 Tax=Methylocella tundrae TaxID=227605 RepID=A0A4U8Z026_METTU|nr:glycosyltransferase [Methylocella tundrae]WPP05599.1 glycosyltransferase [Methylocella tundrae]VFU08051.1 Glycosyltransferase involved in cell wall bisynthesis [Methylocella tundrae]
MQFNIVTPVLNGEQFINETILSVVTQAGPFSVRYHLQDGGSTDSTIKLLAAWQARLANDFPINCKGIEFSFVSEGDRGLYDAVNRGFAACGNADAMSWINADDRLEPGALATVARVFETNPDVDWVTGRPTVIAEGGEVLHMSPIIAFPRKAVAAGIFDGRFARPFIQQEGTFWRPKLWDEVGGLNAKFRLAGDFDLWRRFAKRADLVIIDAILGCFRMRSGQLSENRVSYHAEIDASMQPAEKELRSRASRLYRARRFSYPVIFWRDGRWMRECWPMAVMPCFGGKGFGMEHWRLRISGLLFGGGLPD